MNRCACAAALFYFFLSIANVSIAQLQAPPPPVGGITLDQVIRLSQSGLSDETIIAQIRKRPHPFNLTLDQVLQLKDAHVSNAVILAMMEPADPPNEQSEPLLANSNLPPTTQRPISSVPERPVQIQNAPPPTAVPQPDPIVAPTVPTPSPQPVAPSVQPAAPAPVQPAAQPAPPAALVSAPVSFQSAKLNDGKIRVYVTDRPITEVISMIRGGYEGTANVSGSSRYFSGSAQEAGYVGGIKNDNRGGADPRTLEVSGDILEDCHKSNLVITNNPTVADYVMDFRRQGGKRSTFFIFGGLTGLAFSANMKVDHAALYAANGDLVQVAKARTVGGAVKEVCSHFK